MHRRTFVAAAGGLTAGALAGCSGEESVPLPRIHAVELANYRQDEAHEFHARIEEDGETRFEATEELAPDDPDDAAVVYRDPVSGPGAYEVFVEVDEYDVSVDATRLVSPEEGCVYLDVYLDDASLHSEHLTWPCDGDDD